MKNDSSKVPQTGKLQQEPIANSQLLFIIAVVIFVLMYCVAIYFFGNKGFLKPQTLLTMFNENAALIIVSCGLTIVMITGGIDISVGAVIALVSISCAKYLQNGGEIWIAVMMAVGIGLAFGLFQGFLISFLKIQPFIIKPPPTPVPIINTQLLTVPFKLPKLIALDGSGFTSDNADKYYSKIRGNERKHFTKSHIAIDVDTKIILYSQAVKGPRHDTKFAIASIRGIKKYKPEHILADKAYDTESIRRCINKEIKAK